MITTDGKQHIRRYLGGFVPVLARSIAFGIGNTAETLTNESLQIETGRADIILSTYDFVSDTIVYKATVPASWVGKIYEVALYSQDADPGVLGYGSRMITTFDSDTELWLTGGVAATYSTVNTRVGLNSVSHTPALSATTTSNLDNLGLDFSGNSGVDEFIFALNVGNANTQQVVFRFYTDASNYYTYTVTTPVQTAGYKIINLTKASAVATGAPNWASITSIQVATTSKAAGASAVDLEAIRIEDRDSTNPDYVLISRKVLTLPFTKIAGITMDIEFSLDVTL